MTKEEFINTIVEHDCINCPIRRFCRECSPMLYTCETTAERYFLKRQKEGEIEWPLKLY